MTKSTRRRQWANGTDQLLAGRRFVAIFGALDVPEPAVVKDALARIASAGLHTRLALVPQAGRRIWDSSDAPASVHQLPDTVAAEGFAGVLEYVRRRSGDRRPLEVHLSRRHLVLDIDHGLGDGRFAVELTTALFAISGGGTVPWVDDDDTALALPRSILRTFGSHPARARRALSYAAGLRSTSTVDGGNGSGESVAWSPSFAVAMAHVGADAESAVDHWRRSNASAAGGSAVWLHIVRQALRAAGLPMTDRVTFAFDCRRYLPAGRTANMNFVIGLDLRLGVDESVAALGDRLKELIDSGVPLAGMAAISARGLLHARRQTTPRDRLDGASADVMYTDMGRIAMLEGAPWRDDGQRTASGLVDPAGPNNITILNTRVGDSRDISISYHDNVFDRRVIERAAAYLAEPIQFLASDSSPRHA